MVGDFHPDIILNFLAINMAYKEDFLSPEGKYLGKATSYPKNYNPDLLLAIPRYLNRQQLNLTNESLPFVGFDAWHAYEFGCLTQKGLPVNAVMKIVYPANSPNLIESKSLKLYLNSFNMQRLGKTVNEAIILAKAIITKDLSESLQHIPQITFFTQQDILPNEFDFRDYEFIDILPELEEVEFKHFEENPELLKPSSHSKSKIQICSALLRSNCKITHQPDWGDVFIHIKGKLLPSFESIAEYLVSFRDEKHFHEEICESIFVRFWEKFKPDELMVACIYTRRGGIDISPVRASSLLLLPTHLKNSQKLTKKLMRQ